MHATATVAECVGGWRVVLRTSATEDAGHLDKLDGLLIHFDRLCDFSVGIFGGEKWLIEESSCVGCCAVVRLRGGVSWWFDGARSQISVGLWWVKIWGGASR